MKAFLYSMNLTSVHVTEIEKLCHKSASSIRVALIENAADVVTEGPEGWVEEIRESIMSHGFDVKLIDLREHLSQELMLKKLLSSADVIWIGGGNMYYLRSLLKKSRADLLIQELVSSGTVFCGWSAGGCVAGPTLLYGDEMDDTSKAEELVYPGLMLVDFVMIPHIDNDYFSESAKKWESSLKENGFSTLPLKDMQGVSVNNKSTRII
jgi:dipeptidase E